MKRKEKAHLKEDPLINFVEKSIGAIKKNAKKILYVFLAIGGTVVVVFLILTLKSQSISQENALFTETLNIKDSDVLTVDQKIEKLTQLENKKGISSFSKVFLAKLYFEKGDMKKSAEIIKKLPESKIRLINDEKKLLEAEVLNATNKKQEAIDSLYKIYSDVSSEISKDYLLLRIAKIQIKIDQTKSAITNLNKLTDEFPDSIYAYEAKTLTAKLEKK